MDLHTSTRLKPAADTLSAIDGLLATYDIEGYADHTLNGFDILRSVEVFRGNPRSGYLNLGKGFGLDAALASGRMEAIEMCTIEMAPQVPLVTASGVPHGAWVYGAANKTSHRAPAHMACAADSLLVAGVDLLTGEAAFGFTRDNFLPAAPTCDSVNVSTNGLASGNSLAEAQLHAICELVERHVAAASLKALGAVSKLDLLDLPPQLSDALAEVGAAGMQAEFFLLGRDLDVCVVLCALSRGAARAGSAGTDALQVNFGWGAHHGLTVATARALAEAFQACATRSACEQGSLPSSRMKGGLLMPVEHLSHLTSGSTPWEKVLLSRLQTCDTKQASLNQGSAEAASSAQDALHRLLARARDTGISHIYSWLLSPSERPFSVVKCVIPEFNTFV